MTGAKAQENCANTKPNTMTSPSGNMGHH
jgi:hypothetical protein